MVSYIVHCPILFILTCFMLSFLALNRADAFKCFVCDNKDNLECTENLAEHTTLPSRDCSNITGAKYCVKTTNMYAGEFGTKRFCSAKDLGNRCNYCKQPTGDREYRCCVYTCDSENCNGASTLFNKQYVLYVALIATLLSYIQMTTLTLDQFSLR